MRLLLLSLVALVLAVAAPTNGPSLSVPARQSKGTSQIVLLGTGTPNADPERFGPSVAIVVNDTPYLVDFGPGVVRRASAAFRRGIKGLEVKNLRLSLIHI